MSTPATRLHPDTPTMIHVWQRSPLMYFTATAGLALSIACFGAPSDVVMEAASMQYAGLGLLLWVAGNAGCIWYERIHLSTLYLWICLWACALGVIGAIMVHSAWSQPTAVFRLLVWGCGVLALLVLEFIRRRLVERADPSAAPWSTQSLDRRTMWLSTAAGGLLAILFMAPKNLTLILGLGAAAFALTILGVLQNARSNGADEPVHVTVKTIGIILLGVVVAVAGALGFVVANLTFLHLPMWLFTPAVASIIGIPVAASMVYCLRLHRQPAPQRDHLRP